MLSLALKSAPQTAQRWLLFGGIALLVLGFLVSVTFYRCPHCHRVLPANRGKMDDCPYCKLPLRDTKCRPASRSRRRFRHCSGS